MEIVFIEHGHLYELHYISAGVSWVIVIGGVYGAVRLAIDLFRGLTRKIPTEPPRDSS